MGIAWLISLAALIGAPPQPIVVRPVEQLTDDRLAIAHRGKESVLASYAQGQAGTLELLAWDERLLEAYLDCCTRDEDRLKGLEYFVERATAVRDFEQRRVESRGGQPTAEFLEAAYAVSNASLRSATLRRNAAEMAKFAGERSAIPALGYAEALKELKSNQAALDRAVLWSKRWLHSAWTSTESPAEQQRAVRAHVARLDELAEAIKGRPAATDRPPGVDDALELAYRRAEIQPYLETTRTGLEAARNRQLEEARRARDLVISAAKSDKLPIHPVLTWIDRWHETALARAADRQAREAVLEESVRMLRDLEANAKERLEEGARYVSEPDILALAYARLGAELELAQLRQAAAATSR
jgi:hypothetical protein